jgi:hypothetical protein
MDMSKTWAEFLVAMDAVIAFIAAKRDWAKAGQEQADP